MEEALDNGKILDAEFNRLQDTDMVMRARDVDGRTVYVAIEASGVIGSGDIGRARRSALILTKMYSENAIPACMASASRNRKPDKPNRRMRRLRSLSTWNRKHSDGTNLLGASRVID